MGSFRKGVAAHATGLHHGRMDWSDPRLRDRMDEALNEVEIVGVRQNAEGGADVHVLTLGLPADEPNPPDPRRILRCSGVGEIAVLLRSGLGEPRVDRPAIPLADLDELDRFFAELTWKDAMYGWRFIDVPGWTDDWPDPVSLRVRGPESAADHTLYWFTECGRSAPYPGSFSLEGSVSFRRIEVLRANGTPVVLEDFFADAERGWDEVFARRSTR